MHQARHLGDQCVEIQLLDEETALPGVGQHLPRQIGGFLAGQHHVIEQGDQGT